MIKVAMIGFGGIAQIHRYAYWLLSKNGMPVKLIAACDRDPEKFKVKTKINLPLPETEDEDSFHQYSDIDEMLSSENPDMVDICLPTRLHASIAVMLLERGYSVLCEKPMASTYEECNTMLAAAEGRSNRLMIGQCLRFYPEYEYLQKIIADKTYGNVISSEFFRFSPPPFWSSDNWHLNVQHSGGCLAELNIHDIDFVRWAFGEPDKISCRFESRVTDEDYAESYFYYSGHKSRIYSGWTNPSEKFVHGYTVRFEKALVKMYDGKIILTENGRNEKTVDLQQRDGIIGEIEYFINILYNNLPNTKNPPESSAKTVQIISRLRESAAADSKIIQLIGEKK